MRFHTPIVLEDDVERFMALNADIEIDGSRYLYTGVNNEQVFIHEHKSGAKFGDSIFLDKGIQEMNAIQALIDLLIEGMGTQVDEDGSIYHRADCDEYVVFVGHSKEGASLAIFATGEAYDSTVITLPYNRTGLEVANNLFKQLKP